jgi:hypothetical protein
MPDVKDFLNPKSTLTPGIAGSVAMVAGNSLWVGFGLPQAWTALAVSFLFALLLVVGAPAPLWQRCIYVVLNCLVIFSVGLGANGVGTRATAGSTPQPRSELQQFVIVGRAEAQAPKPTATAEELKRLQDDLKRKNEEVRRLEEALRKSEQQKPSPTEEPSPAGGQRKFFERWKF